MKKGVLKNFAKFTGKYLCQGLFFNKVAATLSKKRLWHMCFPVNFIIFLRIPFFIEHLRCLLLVISINYTYFTIFFHKLLVVKLKLLRKSSAVLLLGVINITLVLRFMKNKKLYCVHAVKSKDVTC